MTAPQPCVAAPPSAEPAPPTVLDALRASPAGPLLDQPLPQIPALGAPVLPPLPQLPPLPPLPGIEQLLAPFNDLASGFGTGVFGSLDPTRIIDRSSQLIDGAMQLAASGLSALDRVWQGVAADCAQQQGRTMQADGAESSQQGAEIATVTREAAAVVQRGNAELAAISTAFVAKATALLPVALTPPGQTALIATATEALGQALAVVSRTRGELAGHTCAMAALVGRILGTGTGQSPVGIARQVIESVGEPLVSTATNNVRTITDSASFPGSSEGHQTEAGEYARTHAAGVGSGHSGGGVGSGHSGGGIGGGLGAAPLSAPSLGGTGATAATAGLGPTGVASGVLSGVPGGGMMGPMASARPASSGGDTVRNSPGYLEAVTDPNGVVGELPQVVSPVLGAASDNL